MQSFDPWTCSQAVDHRPSLLDPCIKMHVMLQYAFKASLAFSILIAAIHHHLNMHIRMAVIECYHSLSFFRGFIMQLPLIQLSGNKAEIFMQIAQFISDTFRRSRAIEMHRRFFSTQASGGLYNRHESPVILLSPSTERQCIWITAYLVHLKSPACIVRSAVITFRS